MRHFQARALPGICPTAASASSIGPSISVSGVRNSWLTLEKNAVFARSISANACARRRSFSYARAVAMAVTDMPGRKFKKGAVALVDPSTRTGSGHQKCGRLLLAGYCDKGHDHDLYNCLRPEIADEFISVRDGNDDGPCSLSGSGQRPKS